MESAKIASESSDSFRRAPAFVDAADGNWPDFGTAFETGRCRNNKRISLKLMVTLFAKEADFHESGSSITRSELLSNAKLIWSLQRHSSRLFPAFLNIAPHANLQKSPVFRLPGCRDTRAKFPSSSNDKVTVESCFSLRRSAATLQEFSQLSEVRVRVKWHHR